MAQSPIRQIDPAPPPIALPTMYDLPSEDPEEPGLPDEFHLWQADLLSYTFVPENYAADRIFVASDLYLYYDPQHTRWHKRPDWFAVVGVPRFYADRDLRLSYVIWQEKVPPIVVVELLSPSTRSEDLGKRKRRGEQPTKWEVYEQILAIPYYVLFDRYRDQLRAFQLVNGRYQPLDLTERKVWIPELKIGLALWQGEFRGQERQWLRWYDAEGNWIPTEAERERQQKELALKLVEQEQQRAEQEQQRAEQEQQRAEQERQRAEQERQQKELALQRTEKLAARLQALGIDPNSLE